MTERRTENGQHCVVINRPAQIGQDPRSELQSSRANFKPFVPCLDFNLFSRPLHSVGEFPQWWQTISKIWEICPKFAQLDGVKNWSKVDQIRLNLIIWPKRKQETTLCDAAKSTAADEIMRSSTIKVSKCNHFMTAPIVNKCTDVQCNALSFL